MPSINSQSEMQVCTETFCCAVSVLTTAPPCYFFLELLRGRGNKMLEKASGLKKKHLEAKLKTGRGSSVCKKLCLQIVEEYQNNVPHNKIAKSLNFSSSTVHNIIKGAEDLDQSLCSRDKAENQDTP